MFFGNLVIAAALLPTTLVSPPAETIASVTGTARVAYYNPNDDVRFTIDARASFPVPAASPYPTRAWGTARVYHYFADAKPVPVTAWADVAVDCVTAGGKMATVTGTVTKASPALEDWAKRKVRLGFSIWDRPGQPDRFGFSGPTPPDQPLLSECMAPAPYFLTRTGGYEVTEPKASR